MVEGLSFVIEIPAKTVEYMKTNKMYIFLVNSYSNLTIGTKFDGIGWYANKNVLEVVTNN